MIIIIIIISQISNKKRHQYIKENVTKMEISEIMLNAITEPNRGAPVAQSVKRWTCDRKVARSNLALEGPF